MSIINATIAAGTRRMLQDAFAWNHARGQDLSRVNAAAAAGMLSRDADGNVKLPDDMLRALLRPFPGSNTTVNVTNLSDGGQAAGDGSGAVSPGAQASGGQSAPPAVNQPQQSGGLPTWLKVAAALVALAGTGGAGAGIASLLKSAPVAAQMPGGQSTPQTIDEMQYELHLGRPQPQGGAGGQ